MIYLPFSRRGLLVVTFVLTLTLIWRSKSHVRVGIPSTISNQFVHSAAGLRVPSSELNQYLRLAQLNNDGSVSGLHDHDIHLHHQFQQKNKVLTWPQPSLTADMGMFWRCPRLENKFTGHMRLSNIIQNISSIPSSGSADDRVFWNPTVLALPYWSKNQYLVVSRILTDGNHQQNVICEANACFIGSGDGARKNDTACTGEDLIHTGAAGGLRCATPPQTISVPPTPAKLCEGKYATYVDIPGFHDPRIFYSSRGEPLMIVNTQSRYACFGLWIIDLRSTYPPLRTILSSSPRRLSLGPPISYSYLTELTRNPPSTRGPIEKNWFLFYPRNGFSYIHYDISAPNSTRGRTFAKLIGGGLTTPNLTSPHETPCLIEPSDEEPDQKKHGGTWHQATDSLRLVLCSRADLGCVPSENNTVFFAILHRKFANVLKLPLRYERFVAVWASVPPFEMVGVSKSPMLFQNETASGWSAEENWHDEGGFNMRRLRRGEGWNSTLKVDNSTSDGNSGNWSSDTVVKDLWAYFTYSVSINWAWRDEVEVEGLGEGYLDDEVVVSIGIDDQGQGMARVKAEDLVTCLRACPGRGL